MIEVIHFFSDGSAADFQMKIISKTACHETSTNFRSINMSQEGDVAQFFNVQSSPVLIIMKDGYPVKKLSGYQPLDKLINVINSCKG